MRNGAHNLSLRRGKLEIIEESHLKGASEFVGLVRDGRYIQTFDHEDLAAEFISIVKMYDPYDDFVYVIHPHPAKSGKLIVKIFTPAEHSAND